MAPTHVRDVSPCVGILESSGEICDHFPLKACMGCKLEIKTCLIQAAVETIDQPQSSRTQNPFTLEDLQNYNRNRDNPGLMPPRITTHDLPASPSGTQTPTDGTAGTPYAWNESHTRNPPDLARLGENSLRMGL